MSLFNFYDTTKHVTGGVHTTVAVPVPKASDNDDETLWLVIVEESGSVESTQHMVI
jgi:hypothetical protein